MKAGYKFLVIIIILMMLNFLVVIIISDNGLKELYSLKQQKKIIISKNSKLLQDNQVSYRTIERLKNDFEYIESIARRDLGMVSEGEVIFKIKEYPGRKTK